MGCVGSAVVAGGILQELPAPQQLEQDTELSGLWFESTDGVVYWHECQVDQDGLWIDEHDGSMQLYEEFEFTDDGISLRDVDGSWRNFWCYTDAEAAEELTEFHYVA